MLESREEEKRPFCFGRCFAAERAKERGCVCECVCVKKQRSDGEAGGGVDGLFALGTTALSCVGPTC